VAAVVGHTAHRGVPRDALLKVHSVTEEGGVIADADALEVDRSGSHVHPTALAESSKNPIVVNVRRPRQGQTRGIAPNTPARVYGLVSGDLNIMHRRGHTPMEVQATPLISVIQPDDAVGNVGRCSRRSIDGDRASDGGTVAVDLRIMNLQGAIP